LIGTSGGKISSEGRNNNRRHRKTSHEKLGLWEEKHAKRKLCTRNRRRGKKIHHSLQVLSMPTDNSVCVETGKKQSRRGLDKGNPRFQSLGGWSKRRSGKAGTVIKSNDTTNLRRGEPGDFWKKRGTKTHTIPDW